MKGYRWMPYILFKDMVRNGDHYEVARVRAPHVIGNILLFCPTYSDEDVVCSLQNVSTISHSQLCNLIWVCCIFSRFKCVEQQTEQHGVTNYIYAGKNKPNQRNTQTISIDF